MVALINIYLISPLNCRLICERFLGIMRPDSGQVNNSERKILDAPINLGEMAANLENEVDTMRSIWVIQRDESLVSNNDSISK